MLQYDGSGNFRVVEATPATAQANGVIGSAGISHWSFPALSSYSATVADNGNVVSTYNSPASYMAVTLPSTTSLPMGWTLGVTTDNGKTMSIQANGTSGGHILYRGAVAASAICRWRRAITSLSWCGSTAAISASRKRRRPRLPLSGCPARLRTSTVGIFPRRQLTQPGGATTATRCRATTPLRTDRHVAVDTRWSRLDHGVRDRCRKAAVGSGQRGFGRGDPRTGTAAGTPFLRSLSRRDRTTSSSSSVLTAVISGSSVRRRRRSTRSAD